MSQERVQRRRVREEVLRAAAGLRHASLILSSWRGRSGRRYVVGVQPLAAADLRELRDTVLLAVKRDADGTAHLVDVAAGLAAEDIGPATWVSAVEAQGATEMHVHRLAETEEERRAALVDLQEMAL
jgi:hypothetical protein